jgi:predicted permease
MGFTRQFQVEGQPPATQSLPTALATVISRDYFTSVGIATLTGRTFSDRDSSSAPLALVVNRAFVERFLPEGAPIGRRIKLGAADSKAPWAAIIGVVADVRNRALTLPPAPEMYIHVLQDGGSWNQLFLLVRTAGDPSAALAPVRGVLSRMDPDQPAYLIQTLEQAAAQTIFVQRAAVAAMSVFAMIALTLAAVGVYGVLSYLASARTLEIGLRMAIGAGGRDVTWLLLRQAAAPLGFGLTLGLVAALALGRSASRLLFEVTPGDPLTLVLVCLALGGVGAAAAFVPARRASRMDPAAALHHD